MLIFFCSYDLEENGKEVEEEKAKMEEDRNALIAELNNIVQEKNEKENVLKREARYNYIQSDLNFQLKF